MGWGEKQGPPLPSGRGRRVKSADELLADHVRQRFREVGAPLDRYDPDFILGTVMGWLGERDAVLTPRGVRKGSDWRKGELQ